MTENCVHIEQCKQYRSAPNCWHTSCPYSGEAKDMKNDGNLQRLLESIHARGGMVAVHNDYMQDGERHTFWLFTFPDGTYLKGEGKTDVEALAFIRGTLFIRGNKQYLS